MPHFVDCPGCDCLIQSDEETCPFCGVSPCRSPGSYALLFGLALGLMTTSCKTTVAAYAASGFAEMESSTVTETESSTDSSSSTPTGTDASSSTPTGTDSTSSTTDIPGTAVAAYAASSFTESATTDSAGTETAGTDATGSTGGSTDTTGSSTDTAGSSSSSGSTG